MLKFDWIEAQYNFCCGLEPEFKCRTLIIIVIIAVTILLKRGTLDRRRVSERNRERMRKHSMYICNCASKKQTTYFTLLILVFCKLNKIKILLNIFCVLIPINNRLFTKVVLSVVLFVYKSSFISSFGTKRAVKNIINLYLCKDKLIAGSYMPKISFFKFYFKEYHLVKLLMASKNINVYALPKPFPPTK